jgi:CubicO group peptidase (beta-lactamase class C family)
VFAELEELVEREMERGKIPGLAIALVRGTEIVWSKGYGYADLENKVAVTPGTAFRVASVTKPVVATALMQWWERGRFKLDDPVNDHLAPVRLRSPFEDRTPVSIRHLLTHTSGLPAQLDAVPTEPSTLPTLEDFVAKRLESVRPPGEEIVYANGGYAALGYLVGRFAGKAYDVALREQVLEPLEMRSSAIGQPPEGTAAARGYFLSLLDGEHHLIPRYYVDSRPDSPACGLFSTVEDLARFLVAHLNGGLYKGSRLLAEKTVAEMHRLDVPAGPSGGGMGLGFMVDRAYGRRRVFHAGDFAGCSAFIGAYPDERAGVAVLANVTGSAAARGAIPNAALRLLVGDYQPCDLGALRREPPPEEWSRVTGRYLWADRDVSLAVEEGVLTLDAEGEKSFLELLEGGAFRAHDGFFDGFRFAFEYGEDGKAARFYTGIWRADRQGDVVARVEPNIDEKADLTGRWSGTCVSPMGVLPIIAEIGADDARVTVLSAQQACVEEFRSGRGRLSGNFQLAMPGFGDFRVFVKVAVDGGGLRGEAYARGALGEFPMRVELTRDLALEGK